jgi:Flp pilus assembly protein TadG
VKTLRQLLGQNGTSTLEFIVVLPTLLFIFLAAVELSRGWLTAHVATSAVREGARIAAVTPAASAVSAGISKVTYVLGSANLTAQSGPKVTCTCALPACTLPPSPPPSQCVPDATVDVVVTVRFQTLFPVFLPMLQTMDITEKASMRYE